MVVWFVVELILEMDEDFYDGDKENLMYLEIVENGFSMRIIGIFF